MGVTPRRLYQQSPPRWENKKLFPRDGLTGVCKNPLSPRERARVRANPQSKKNPLPLDGGREG